LLLRGAALLTLAELNLGPLVALALVWAGVWGRVAPLLAMQWFPYLRREGTAAFHRRHWLGLGRELRPSLLLLTPLTLVAASMGWPFQGWLGLLPAALVPWYLGRRLGGHSGDTYGACVDGVETLTLALLALAALV
jgi:adenosylcobinamide-GDP ribazoletransferase